VTSRCDLGTVPDLRKIGKLKNFSRKIDGDIEKLTKTWESPHLLIGGYGGDVEEAAPYVERFLGDIKSIQDKLIADQEPRTKYLADLRVNVKSMETSYELTKEYCSDVETLLSDWGYRPVTDRVENDSPAEESRTDSSILSPETMDDSLLLCTNNSGRNNEDALFAPTVKANGPKSIAAPVVASLASVMKSTRGNGSGVASSNDPSKDFLSPYYGRRLK